MARLDEGLAGMSGSPTIRQRAINAVVNEALATGEDHINAIWNYAKLGSGEQNLTTPEQHYINKLKKDDERERLVHYRRSKKWNLFFTDCYKALEKAQREG